MKNVFGPSSIRLISPPESKQDAISQNFASYSDLDLDLDLPILSISKNRFLQKSLNLEVPSIRLFKARMGAYWSRESKERCQSRSYLQKSAILPHNFNITVQQKSQGVEAGNYPSHLCALSAKCRSTTFSQTAAWLQRGD
jgi:hypothetical protein